MTQPQHPWTPCPPNNPHCNETQPPNPGNPNAPTVDISSYIPLLMLVAVIFIFKYYKSKQNGSSRT